VLFLCIGETQKTLIEKVKRTAGQLQKTLLDFLQLPSAN